MSTHYNKRDSRFNGTDRATEIILLLDQSGSMSSRREETIQAVNDFLSEQRTVPGGKTFVSIYKFNSEFETWFEAEPASTVPEVTRRDYRPAQMTALFDAIGETVERTEFRTNCCEDDPRVVLVIMTDGHENSSQRFGHRAVRRLLDRMQGRGWELVFLGADVRAMRQAEDLGIRSDRAVRFSIAPGKVRDSMELVSSKVALFSMAQDAGHLDFNENDRRKMSED